MLVHVHCESSVDRCLWGFTALSYIHNIHLLLYEQKICLCVCMVVNSWSTFIQEMALRSAQPSVCPLNIFGTSLWPFEENEYVTAMVSASWMWYCETFCKFPLTLRGCNCSVREMPNLLYAKCHRDWINCRKKTKRGLCGKPQNIRKECIRNGVNVCK